LLVQRRSGSALRPTGRVSQESVLAESQTTINPAGIPPPVEARSADFDFRAGYSDIKPQEISDLKSRRRLLAFLGRPPHAPFAEHFFLTYPLSAPDPIFMRFFPLPVTDLCGRRLVLPRRDRVGTFSKPLLHRRNADEEIITEPGKV